MQRRRLLWGILLGMVVVTIVAVLWHRNNEGARTRGPVQAAKVEPRHEPVPELLQNQSVRPVPVRPVPAAPDLPDGTKAKTNVSHNIPLLAYRVKNTQKPLSELMYSESAILLRNALFDASDATPLEIPAHLKAQGDPGSYVVQARGPIDSAFLARLKSAGAEIISYIPNNAYLVRAPGTVANQLAVAPETQSVLPWEPYFKLDLSLLARAVNNEPLADNERVSVVVFPGQREAGIKAIEDLGGTIVAEDGSPFGHQLIAHPRPDTIVALAQLPIVQSIEPSRGRVLLNDLSRVRVSVSTNTLPAGTNYLNLYGSNIIVNVNDTGGEAAHPDLTGRVIGATPAARFDNNGHGTHVIGTIISSGQNSPPNGPGSLPGATFRGIAPAAKVFAQRIDLLTGPNSDTAMQQTVARTNILISNNSWGYPIFEYNQSAALYDAAVRDALPGVAGATPMIFVFAAGNSGEADFEGRGFAGDEVLSPGTAKNVISVGAIENLRNLTNSFQIGGNTNAYFLPETDSEDQVAFYSSRGNVGVGLEGDFGRFKPDVVAPGSWLISCRSSQWRDPDSLLSFNPLRLVDQFIDRKGTNFYFRTIPDNASALVIYLLRNPQSPANLPRLVVHTNFGTPPVVSVNNRAGAIPPPLQIAPVSGGQVHFALVNTNSIGVHYDLLTIVVTTNDLGEYFKELKALNDQLLPYYRFESGTSMSAGVVSGTLALMQEFFEKRLGRTNVSPALYKAMLINGARSLPCLGCEYDLQVRKQINNQGWGSIRLTNSIPKAMAGGSGTEPSWPMILVDQDTNSALATGESHTYNIQMSTRARFEPLLVTLVWTDPPGNPVASMKLVNDLDLIVTNVATGDWYVGNNIPGGSDFNEPTLAGDSNAPPFDVVNNVENVYVDSRLGSNYTVTVRARRVNVNAITGNTNGTRQDYALVISSGNSTLTNTFLNVNFPIAKTQATDTYPYLQNLSNKVALLNQRVGANSPQLPVVPGNLPGPSDGSTNQWNFYVFNNTNALFTNVAFFTFMAPDLSLPRVREADIDLYVSRDGSLTNLNPIVINGSSLANGTLKSLTRGGTELVVIPNAGTGEYFIGVKSEDQQAAQFGIFAIAQQKPFGEPDEDGNYLLDFDITDGCIPDGSPANPGGRQFFTIIADFNASGGTPRTMRRVTLTNDVDHQLGGDLLGTVTVFPFGGGGGLPVSAVLNNHRAFAGPNRFIYDDSGENDIPFSRQSDGPGTLRDLEGKSLTALWQFTMVDNTPFHTGCVQQVIGLIEPQQDTNSLGNGIRLRLGPGQWRYTAIDVPVGVTNLQVFVRQEPGFQLPVDVFIRRGARPTLTTYDKYGRVNYPGGVVEHGRYDFPSLRSGRYHIGIYNPNSAPVELRLVIAFQYQLNPIETVTYTSPNAPTIIPDDVVTNFIIAVTNARTVADVKVGVRIDHPRVSDLALRLISPEGTRILLTENRGLSLGTNYGEGVPVNFIVPFGSGGGPLENRTNINTFNRQAIVRVNYDYFNVPDTLHVYYEGKRIFDSGPVSGAGVFNIPFGPGLSTFVELVMNEGNNPSPGTAWTNVISVTGPWNYAVFTDKGTLGDPIKFGFPPFSRIPTNITVFSNSFENILAGMYASNAVIDSWTVTSNAVGVMTDTNVFGAHSGSNFLALSHGAISRGLTNLLPGHEYILRFGEHKISSSPTQNIRVPVPTYANPFTNLNPPPGPLPGNPFAVPVPKLRVCPGQDVVIISTNRVFFGGTNTFDARGDTNNLDPNNGFPKYGLLGCWSSHPTVLTPNTTASQPFYIGGGLSNNVVITAPDQPGDYYLFLGVNGDIVGANVRYFQVDCRWAQCQLANANYTLGTTPVHFDGRWGTNWPGESLFFIGNPTTTNFGFSAGHNSTILLDTVMIDELVPSAHYQSEEPLAPLQGETALGEWKLEVTDNRVGPEITGTNFPTLLSWALTFTFDDGPNPIPLTNGVWFTNIVSGPEMHYFVVNVPLEVNTNLIRFSSSGNNGGVELLYSTTGLPEGAQPPDPILPLGEPASPFGVSSNYPPVAPIAPGRQYFLAIRNSDPNTPANTYWINVDFVNVPITRLLPDVPIAANIAPLPATFLQTRNNSSLAVANMHYYYFDVGSSGELGITNLFFEVTSPTGQGLPNVHLVVSRALPVSDLFPRPTFYEYHSTESTAPDKIIISSNSIPVNLRYGSRWYLGVYNVGPAPTNYIIRAHEEDVSPVFTLNYLDLRTTNAVVTNFTAVAGNVLNSFYHFITDRTNAAVLVEIFDISAGSDPDLILRRSDLPSRDLYDFSFLNTNAARFNVGYEPVPMRTNVFIPTFGVNTNWYFAIANRGTQDAAGTLCVKIFTNINPIVGCPFNLRFGPPAGGLITPCWDGVPGTTYDVESSTDLINWIPVPGSTGIAGQTGQTCGGAIPVANTSAFFRVRAY